MFPVVFGEAGDPAGGVGVRATGSPTPEKVQEGRKVREGIGAGDVPSPPAARESPGKKKYKKRRAERRIASRKPPRKKPDRLIDYIPR
jgi:hypothetical protein